MTKSPYDDSGMPLGTTTADYDNADEVRLNQVKSTYEEPIPLNDPKYQTKQFTKKETGQDKDKGLPHGEKGFNSAIADGAAESLDFLKTLEKETPKEETPKDKK